MKIVSYMPVYNEADVLPFVLDHMREQGVHVHALDGWSTDGSQEILSTTPGVTVERFPADGPSNEQACREILRRIEDLAAQSDADWCYQSDADEWRRSPRAGETLAQAIARVDDAGYNAIDHRVFNFYCTGNRDGRSLTGSHWKGNPESYFRYYTDHLEMICRIPQLKAWKNIGRVSLAHSGGHVVDFPGIRIAPEKFVMKHYPYRTAAQARAKLETRLKRRCHAEHRDGWGVHYDEFPPDFDFCWDPADLKFWPDPEAPLPL